MIDRLKSAWDALTYRRDTALSSVEREGLDLIAHDLSRSREDDGPFGRRGSLQTWRETLFVSTADLQAPSNSTTEATMAPNFLLPANYLYAGRCLKWTCLFDWSTVITTPGTVTMRLRGGTNTAPASNTSLAASGAFAPDTTAASTNITGMVEYWFVQRATGTAAASYTMGRVEWSDFIPTTVATLITGLDMRRIPQSAPATANLDTTVANYVMPSATTSVSTATTQVTTHIALLEALT